MVRYSNTDINFVLIEEISLKAPVYSPFWSSVLVLRFHCNQRRQFSIAVPPDLACKERASNICWGIRTVRICQSVTFKIMCGSNTCNLNSFFVQDIYSYSTSGSRSQSNSGLIRGRVIIWRTVLRLLILLKPKLNSSTSMQAIKLKLTDGSSRQHKLHGGTLMTRIAPPRTKFQACHVSGT